MAKVVIKDSTMPKVKVKPSKTKKIDPAVVAKALGAEIVLIFNVDKGFLAKIRGRF